MFLAGQANFFQDGTLFPGGLGTCISGEGTAGQSMEEEKTGEDG